MQEKPLRRNPFLGVFSHLKSNKTFDTYFSADFIPERRQQVPDYMVRILYERLLQQTGCGEIFFQFTLNDFFNRLCWFPLRLG